MSSQAYHIVLTFFWMLYCFLHSFMASLWFKHRVERLTGKMFSWYRLFYSCVAALLLILLLIFQYTHPSIKLFSTPVFVRVLTMIVGVGGIAIMAVAIKRYFFMLSGVAVLTNEDKKQIPLQQGINGYMRHPLYSGTLLLLWSLFILFPLLNNLIACVIITSYTLVGIRLEENKLVIEFGELYKSYQQKVPMLIPSLRRSV